MSELIKRLRDRIATPSRATDMSEALTPKIFPPATADALARAEKRFGAPLPAFLRQIFLEVANGGFGPAYGLLGLPGGAVNELGDDCIALYEAFREPNDDDPLWQWPEQLLPLGHLGCGMYTCVQCGKGDAPLIWFEPNPHCDGEPWDDSFIPFADSLESWLECWLDGVEGGMFEEAFNRKLG